MAINRRGCLLSLSLPTLNSMHPLRTIFPKLPFLLSHSSSHSSSTMVRTLLVISLELLIISLLFGQSPVSALMDGSPPRPPPPAFFAFGDSILDTGNNNNITSLMKCNFLPYGRDFKGGNKPTGRFCNGKVPSDFLAELTGVKEYLPPYMDPNLKMEDLLTGVSFASGGTGYDPLTSKIASVISLPDQLNLFKNYTRRIAAAVGRKQAADIVRWSIYIVMAGSNDIANNYYTLPFRKATHDVDSYTDLLVDNATSFYQGLYYVGARRIGVFSAPPIGCVPGERTLDGGPLRECSDKQNAMALLFNRKLSDEIDALNRQLRGSRIMYINVYSPIYEVIKNYADYGFKVVNKGCCGTGNIELSALCTLSEPINCRNASSHVFWDSFHPTERAYEIISKGIMSNYISKL
ncbi:hypothetical protein SAY87_029084 [Trapa incisa]|uniref:GDSL esterase/lipase EXL3 n=1 Tax=Trapa incisa TaxID=236973 RepID=A0AAN7QSN1_9MYRT|nr:hypothetical protein SAY87_029084 [Trapa incisa]